MDQGKAANTAGVPDPLLKARLQQVLKLLGLKRAGSKVRACIVFFSLEKVPNTVCQQKFQASACQAYMLTMKRG